VRRTRNKYGARRTEYLGIIWDSAAEANYAAILELQRKGGKIARWERGTAQILIDGPNRSRRVTYKPDFIVYYGDQTREAIDVKGCVPRDFRIKALLWEQRFPNLPLRVIDRDGNTKWTLEPAKRSRRKAA
jgi:hypothetical protein